MCVTLGYIAECFRLLHVVVGGPKVCILLVGFHVTSDMGARETKTTRVAQIFTY